MKFSTLQIIGSLSLPISFLSLLLGTISWHFHVREVVLDNLSLKQKISIAPFFLSIIVTKVWVLAHLLNTVTILAEAQTKLAIGVCIALFTPLILIIGIQILLHFILTFSVKSALLGSIANLTTLWRPSHDESQNQQSFTFYKFETLLSCILLVK